MNLTLSRFAYTPTDTQGVLRAGEWSCFTIERPWLRWSYPGGEPEKSCIPDGRYDLVPFIRPNHDKVFALVNPLLGVYLNEDSRPVDSQHKGLGRYLCLIHPANRAAEVKGCIAPGRTRAIDKARAVPMVTSSRATMTDLIALAGWVPGHSLTVTQAHGAVDTPMVTQ